MTGSLASRRADALVAHYLERLVAGDWEAVAECLAPDVVRLGPFADVYRGREPYVAYLAQLMPTLPGYAMEVHRILACEPAASEAPSDAPSDTADAQEASRGRGLPTVMAELSETVEMNGAPVVTEETLVFDLDGDRRITRIAIYLRRT